MSWEEIIAKLRTIALNQEQETCSHIADSNELEVYYKKYLADHEEHEILFAILENIQDMDQKLNKILERLG